MPLPRTDGDRSDRQTWLRVGAIAALFLAGVLLARQLGYFSLRNPQRLQQTVEQVRGLPWLAPAFVALYAVASTLALPLTPLALAAGALFGTVKGSLLVWGASLIGAAAGYWLARLVGAQAIRRLIGHEEVLDRFRDGRGALAVFRIQLLPITPFGLVNVAAAIAGVPFFEFLAGTALAIIPGTVAYVWVGDRLAAGVMGRERHALRWAGVAAIVLIVLSFVPTIARRMQGRERGVGGA